jgi:hypothetical protein
MPRQFKERIRLGRRELLVRHPPFELAGHQDLGTTQRYMHLSPAAVQGAIRLLDQPAPHFGRMAGDILESRDFE